MRANYRAILLLLFFVCLLSCKYGDEQTIYKSNISSLQLDGIILSIPDKADLELALFALDNNNRPKKLLVVEHYKGNGNTLNFQLKFDISGGESFLALELRGRVTQSGRLVGYLVPWYKQQLTKQDLKGIILELASENALGTSPQTIIKTQ